MSQVAIYYKFLVHALTPHVLVDGTADDAELKMGLLVTHGSWTSDFNRVGSGLDGSRINHQNSKLYRRVSNCGSTYPKRPPREVIAKEELFDVRAVSDQAFQRHSVHRNGIRKHHQLQPITQDAQAPSSSHRGQRRNNF